MEVPGRVPAREVVLGQHRRPVGREGHRRGREPVHAGRDRHAAGGGGTGDRRVSRDHGPDPGRVDEPDDPRADVRAQQEVDPVPLAVVPLAEPPVVVLPGAVLPVAVLPVAVVVWGAMMLVPARAVELVLV